MGGSWGAQLTPHPVSNSQVLLGEWGGSWEARTWNGHDIPNTATWQTTLRDYLRLRNMSSFYWTLNDNSYKTGSLFHDPHAHEKAELLSHLPATSLLELQVRLLLIAADCF